MQMLARPILAPASRTTTSDCIASSRVGASTSTRAPPLDPLGGGVAQCIIAGRKKASVLPEPVSATPTMSRPAIITGQHAAWIGVGFANAAHAASTALLKPASAKPATGRNASAPLPVISIRCSLKKACAAAGDIIATGDAAALLSADAAGAGAAAFSVFFFFAAVSVSSSILRFSGAAGAGAAPPALTSVTDEPSCLKIGSSSFSAKIFAAFFFDLPSSMSAATTVLLSVSRARVFLGALVSASLISCLHDDITEQRPQVVGSVRPTVSRTGRKVFLG
mmetsp:Transcript_11088/g.29197  ORF Transcript_11088/g.29197 Transcript_11088/m.29197 type:complete len:279 (+) Transcript_11088:647-1483(+)